MITFKDWNNGGGVDSFANYTGSHDYDDWYICLTRSRDSDHLTNSNFETALEALGGESSYVEVMGTKHWAVGWLDWLMIKPTAKKTIEKAESLNKETVEVVRDGLEGVEA